MRVLLVLAYGRLNHLSRLDSYLGQACSEITKKNNIVNANYGSALSHHPICIPKKSCAQWSIA